MGAPRRGASEGAMRTGQIPTSCSTLAICDGPLSLPAGVRDKADIVYDASTVSVGHRGKAMPSNSLLGEYSCVSFSHVCIRAHCLPKTSANCVIQKG